MVMKYTATKQELDKSEVEFTGEIASETFEGYREHAYEHLGADLEVPGFRKGKAPKDILIKHIPEMTVLDEMANHAINDIYPKLLTEHSVNAIGNPAVKITKIAPGNPLGFTIRTAVMPEVKLPDYKAIAKKEGSEIKVEVTEEEFEKALMQIRQMRAQGIKENIEREKKEAGETPAEEASETTEKKDESEPELPLLTDEFVQTLGEFKDVEDFKTKFRENVRLDKEHREHEKNRLAIMEKIIEQSEVAIPEILVEGELDRMLFRMKTDISGMGLSYDDYLKHLGKSEEAIRDEFRTDGEKRVKMELIMSEIVAKENLTVDEETMNKEVEQVLQNYPGADRKRAEAYVEQVLLNEQVFKLLENQK